MLLWMELFALLADYRQERPVTEYMLSLHAEPGHYLCPRCHVSLEREFTAFCDRCGQHLGWRDYKSVRKIYPGLHNFSQN